MNQRTAIDLLNLNQSQALALLSDKYDEPVSIALAQSSDLSDVVDIYNQSISTKASTADLTPVTTADRQSWFDAHLSQANRPIYVVKNTHNQLMAWGSFSNVKNRPAYDISSEISIYVGNNFHRRGLAGILLTVMLEQAPSLGINNILALIFAHNTASLALFKKFGFEQWGVMPNICDMGDFTADVVTLGKVVSS